MFDSDSSDAHPVFSPDYRIKRLSCTSWILGIAILVCALAVSAAEPASPPDYEFELKEGWDFSPSLIYDVKES